MMHGQKNIKLNLLICLEWSLQKTTLHSVNRLVTCKNEGVLSEV